MDLSAVYSRELEDRVLTPAASGWTYDSTFVLEDPETGTLWFPQGDDLRGIQGPLRGRILNGIPFVDTTWGAWKARHPESGVIR